MKTISSKLTFIYLLSGRKYRERESFEFILTLYGGITNQSGFIFLISFQLSTMHFSEFDHSSLVSYKTVG